MTKSEIFKTAHQIAKASHQPGDYYPYAFGQALKSIYESQKESNMTESDKEAASMLIDANDDAVLVKIDSNYWIATSKTTSHIVCTKKQAVENNYWNPNWNNADEDADLLAALGLN